MNEERKTLEDKNLFGKEKIEKLNQERNIYQNNIPVEKVDKKNRIITIM